MKGKNVLRINQATLVQALQEHFDRVMPGQKVLLASRVSGNSWDSSELDEVVVEFEAVERVEVLALLPGAPK